MISLKSAASLLVVLAASLALLIPLAFFSPPRDSEVWLFQGITEMQGQHLAPMLNNAPLKDCNPMMLSLLSFLPVREISSPRLFCCISGLIFIVFVFLYSLEFFDLLSAFASSLVAMTSLGFLALFGTLNLMASPVTLAATAFGFFSIVYLKRLHAPWYIVSYVLAALAAVTGGYFMLIFFLLGALLLILFDLAPSELLSIHPFVGASIIACAMISFFASYRIGLGQGFTSRIFSPGDHLGLFKGLYAVITYGSPWIFLIIPAWLHGGGPSDQEAWRKLLPPRIAIILGFLMLWFSSSSLPQYAAILVVFTAPLIGRFISRSIFHAENQGSLIFWMMTVSGLSAFLCAFVFLLLPLRFGFALQTKQLIAAAGFLAVTSLFIYFTFRRKMPAQFVLIGFAVAFIVWYMAFLSPKDQWDRKISFMEGISRNRPLVVYEDDLIMRGYMSTVNAKAMIVDRNIVPLNDSAFLAVSTPDLNGLIDGLKARMNAMVVDSYRAENTYALVMISPKQKLE